MMQIPELPVLKLDDVQAYGAAAVGIVIGTTVTLWGLKLHRVLAAVGGICVGFALTPIVQNAIEWNPGAVQIIVVCVAAALAGIFTRISWGVFAGVLGAAMAWGALVILTRDDAVTLGVDAGFWTWMDTVVRTIYSRDLMAAVWRDNQPGVMVSVVPAALAPLASALIFHRMTTAITTSLVGAVPAVAGVVLAASHLWNRLWPTDPTGWLVIGGCIVGMTVSGTFLQYARIASLQQQLDEAAGA